MRSKKRLMPAEVLVVALLASATFAACGGAGQVPGKTTSTGSATGTGGAQSSGTQSGGHGGGNVFTTSTGSGTSTGTGGGAVTVDTNYPCTGCDPFPASGAPACDPTKLGAPTIAYPLDGLLLPPNMNVLEVQFVPPAGATLFEVDFTNAVTTVKVETPCNAVIPVRGGASTGCAVTLPQGAWNDIANTNRDGDPVHVTVRATADGSCVSSSTAKIDLLFAKEDIQGGIYYWQSATFGGIAGTTGGIYSHDFGALDPTPTPFYTSGASGTCVGCHYLSRDGLRMAVSTDDPDADDEFGDMHAHVMDVPTRTVIGGKNMSPGFQTFTHDHARLVASTWKMGMNKSFAVFNGDGAALLATDALPTGVTATQPDLSKDDATLVYVVPKPGTIPNAGDHHFAGGSLFTSTFDAANHLGAPVSVLASTGTKNFYYPAISPDGSFLLFNEAPDGDAFYNRNARVKVLHLPPVAGAQPIDLPALNVADGLTNSWPRWSPFVQSYKGHKLLWVTFSSNRDYGLRLANQNSGFQRCYPTESPAGAPWNDDVPPNFIPASKNNVSFATCEQPQIWMAAVIIDADPTLDAKDRSFPAFWLPFQDVSSHNHSAQWVEQIQGGGGNPGDGGTPDGGGPDGGGGSCGESGAPCGGSGPGCCTDMVCCSGSCQPTCIK
jgi:uncharacterized membrane protein YgcG